MRLRLWGLELSLGRPAADPQRPAKPPEPETFDPLHIIAGLSEGLMAVDERRHVLLCNPALAPVLNRPPAEAAGRPLWEVLRHREVGELLDRVLATGVAETREILFPLPTETVWRTTARPLGRGAVLTFLNLTDLKRLESLRKDFVANVSHELKTPLTSLRAALETLLDGALEDRAHAREFIEVAQTQVERLQRLIEDLLTLSRLDRPAPTDGSAAASAVDAAKAALATVRPLADKKGLRLDAGFPGEDLRAAASADELSQILLNLLDNAVKFNSPGGRVTLALRRTGDAAEIIVSDDGPGIPAEDQPRIFERFYRVDKARSAGGTGLGLAIVKHIIENRKGTIRLESAAGAGASFTVTLPLA